MTALRKVLVVDDDPVVGASFRRVLSGKGYIVVSAESGFDALERLRGEQFDAVFTDLRMPGMDGLQVAREVRTAQPWTPVVIITGYGSAASEAQARAAAVAGFVQKPLSPEVIEDIAERAVRAIQQQRVEPIREAATPAAAVPERRLGVAGVLKNMALFLAGPFIGLLYAVLLPFVGLGMLVGASVQSLREGTGGKTEPSQEIEAPPSAAREAAAAPGAPALTAAPTDYRGAALVALQMLAAPFVGLAFIVVMPFAGLGALAWLGLKAALVRGE